MTYVGGVDVGSTQSKGVVMDEGRRIVGRGLVNTGANVTRAAERAFEAALADAGLGAGAVAYVIGTGYGRYKVTFGNAQVTEISCHARGASHLFPGTHTVVDIGGQDTKAIRIGPEGQVHDFVMNDKCAAGTGRFLGAAAEVFDLSLDALGPLSLRSTRPLRITTTCTVFVETELISYLAQKKKIEDILMGMHKAIAGRSAGLLRRVGLDEEVTFTGGVSKNEGMVRALEEELGMKVNVSEESHFMGAIGASLFALERAGEAAA